MFKVTADLVKKCQKYKDELDLDIKTYNIKKAFEDASSGYNKENNREAFQNLIRERNNKLKKLHALNLGSYDRNAKKVYEEYQGKLENIIFKYIKAYYEIEKHNTVISNSADNYTKKIAEDLGQVLGVNKKEDSIKDLFYCIDNCIDEAEYPPIEKEYFENEVKFSKDDIDLNANVSEYINEKDEVTQIEINLDPEPTQINTNNEQENKEKKIEKTDRLFYENDETINTYGEGYCKSEIYHKNLLQKYGNTKKLSDALHKDLKRRIDQASTNEEKRKIQREKNDVEVGLWISAKRRHEKKKWGIHFIQRIADSIRLNKLKKNTGLSDESLNNIYSTFERHNFLRNNAKFQYDLSQNHLFVKRKDVLENENEIDLSNMNFEDSKALDDLTFEREFIKEEHLKNPTIQKEIENYKKSLPKTEEYQKDPRYINKEDNQKVNNQDENAIEDENGLLLL